MSQNQARERCREPRCRPWSPWPGRSSVSAAPYIFPDRARGGQREWDPKAEPESSTLVPGGCRGPPGRLVDTVDRCYHTRR